MDNNTCGPRQEELSDEELTRRLVSNGIAVNCFGMLYKPELPTKDCHKNRYYALMTDAHSAYQDYEDEKPTAPYDVRKCKDKAKDVLEIQANWKRGDLCDRDGFDP